MSPTRQASPAKKPAVGKRVIRANAAPAQKSQAKKSQVKKSQVKKKRAPPATGVELIERVTRAIERELMQIEVIVGGYHVKQGHRTEAERRARTLASLARTLTEVTRLRAADKQVKTEDDDALPRNLDELRRTLSQRLEKMVAVPTQLPAGGDE